MAKGWSAGMLDDHFFFYLVWESRDVLSLASVPGIWQYSEVFCHVGN